MFRSFAFGKVVVCMCFQALATSSALAGDAHLYLEVFINDASTELIARFTQRGAGRLSSAPEELRELRIEIANVPPNADGEIDLDEIEGLAYDYDQATQKLEIRLDNSRRTPFFVNVRQGATQPLPPAEQAAGAVLNYSVFAATDAPYFNIWSREHKPSVSAVLDARVFGEYGVFSQSAILTTAELSTVQQSLRLNSTWSYSDRDTLVTYRGGDVISGGLSWTRSVRLGGVQIQRNFSLRPDLVTLPTPAFGGTAAVPSTVDVFLNNTRSYSGQLPAGPYQLQNLPTISGASTHRIVVQDSSGRETVISQPFYTSTKMLAAGLVDYSVETGFTRLNYGIESNDYMKTPVASASTRFGAADFLTVEGHVEGGGSLFNIGGGANVALSNWGVGSLAAAISDRAGQRGALFSAALEFGRSGFTFYARSQRTTKHYADLASLPATNGVFGFSSLLLAGPPKELDQIAIGIPLQFDPSSVTFSFTRMHDNADNRYSVLGLSYSRAIGSKASFFLTGFADLSNRRSVGAYAGLSLPLDGGISAITSVSGNGSGLTGGIDVIKSQPVEADSWGWRLRDREGAAPVREAALSYRSSVGRAEAAVQHLSGRARATAQVEGAIAIAGSSAFLANKIDDSFAVVKAGAADVDVFYENRPVARTRSDGTALVPYLRANQHNKISIDPARLPIDTEVGRTTASVVPQERSAVVVDFGVVEDARTALVVLRDAANEPIAVGSSATIVGTDKEVIVGYGGEVYLQRLAETNELAVVQPGGKACKAGFAYEASRGQRVVIDNVICR